MHYESLDELALKIDHEGGICAALQYGIRHNNVPPAIQREWAVLEQLYEAFMSQYDSIDLPDPGEASERLYDYE